MRTRIEIEEDKSAFADNAIVNNPYEVNIAKLSLEVLLDIRELLMKEEERIETWNERLTKRLTDLPLEDEKVPKGGGVIVCMRCNGTFGFIPGRKQCESNGYGCRN